MMELADSPHYEHCQTSNENIVKEITTPLLERQDHNNYVTFY